MTQRTILEALILVTLTLTVVGGLALRARLGPKRILGKYQNVAIFGWLAVFAGFLIFANFHH